jgi:hypothetical protein
LSDRQHAFDEWEASRDGIGTSRRGRHAPEFGRVLQEKGGRADTSERSRVRQTKRIEVRHATARALGASTDLAGRIPKTLKAQGALRFAHRRKRRSE